jgi:hypothetical protein
VNDSVKAFRQLREGTAARRKLGSIALRLIRSAELGKDTWALATGDLVAVFNDLYGDPSREALDYLVWEDLPGLTSSAKSQNQFSFVSENNGAHVTVQVKSIHAVKGQTHPATLVLETFNRTHDLKQLLPYLSGARSVTGKEDRAQQQRLRTIYVALSRPNNLVCLALNSQHVTEKELKALAARWAVIMLTTN